MTLAALAQQENDLDSLIQVEKLRYLNLQKAAVLDQTLRSDMESSWLKLSILIERKKKKDGTKI